MTISDRVWIGYRAIILPVNMELTKLELVLLQLIERGKGQWSWYELASALSRRDVPREPDMMTVLKNLAHRGLVKRYVEKDSPRDHWELTLERELLLSRTTGQASQNQYNLSIPI